MADQEADGDGEGSRMKLKLINGGKRHGKVKVNVPLTLELRDALVAAGLIKWTERADPLAIGKALNAWLQSWIDKASTVR
jgi:hypothetical protein